MVETWLTAVQIERQYLRVKQKLIKEVLLYWYKYTTRQFSFNILTTYIIAKLPIHDSLMPY